MTRVRLVESADAEGEVAEFFEVLVENFKKVPNLFATVAHYPGAMKPLLELFDSLYNQSDLDPRLLEFVIIKISFGYQSHYCLTLHKAFALERGATNEEIRALDDPSGLASFPEDERVALEFARQFAEDPLDISDELYQRLSEHYSESQIVNLTLLMGLASLFGQTANALRIPIDSFIGVAPPHSH